MCRNTGGFKPISCGIFIFCKISNIISTWWIFVPHSTRSELFRDNIFSWFFGKFYLCQKQNIWQKFWRNFFKSTFKFDNNNIIIWNKGKIFYKNFAIIKNFIIFFGNFFAIYFQNFLQKGKRNRNARILKFFSEKFFSSNFFFKKRKFFFQIFQNERKPGILRSIRIGNSEQYFKFFKHFWNFFLK